MSFRRTSKTLRARRYWDLRGKHFTPVESREFSKLTRKYPALQRLIASRTALWAGFVQECQRKGWETEHRRFTEWRTKVVGFYGRQRAKRKRDKDTGLTVETLANWIVKKDVHGREYRVPKISPWEWYDWVFQRLPEELKWDTPRGHRTKQPDVEVDKIQTRRWVEDLKKSIERTTDEREQARFRQQIKNLEGSLRKR